MKREDLRIGDPFIVKKDSTYYMYKAINDEFPERIDVYESNDLENWYNPKTIYTLTQDSWKEKDLWAPEVHEYNGKYYLFVSIKGKNGLRGTEISICDTPYGAFIPITDRAATPLNMSSIDGTFYLDGDTPYIIFSRDWPDNYQKEKDAYVGQICGQELSKDLKTPIGEPFLLFNSDDVPYSKNSPSRHMFEDLGFITRYGSDAPFINKLSNGTLFLTWCPFPNNNYVVLGATSNNIRGLWKHIEKPLFDKNGGHAMFFTTIDGKKKMVIHCPEEYLKERALILDVIEKDGQLIVKK